jgi:hypothetical protein
MQHHKEVAHKDKAELSAPHALGAAVAVLAPLTPGISIYEYISTGVWDATK